MDGMDRNMDRVTGTRKDRTGTGTRTGQDRNRALMMRCAACVQSENLQAEIKRMGLIV